MTPAWLTVLAIPAVSALACGGGAAGKSEASGNAASGTPETAGTLAAASTSGGTGDTTRSGTGGTIPDGSGGVSSGGSTALVGSIAAGGMVATMISNGATATGTDGGAGGTVGGGATQVGGSQSSIGGAGGTAGASSGTRGALGAGGTASGDPTIVDLFNGTDLTGWTAYRQTSETSPGTELTPEQALQIFQVKDGMIHVYGDAADQSMQERHTLVSAQSYSKYVLSWEYKWGTKVFAPYTDLSRYPRDAGLLFHIHGDRTQVWPPSIEFQNKEGTTGDIFALYSRCTSLALNGGTTFVDAADGGTEKLVDGSNGYVQHSRSQNFEVSDWNQLELQVDGASAVYLVNGHQVNRVLNVMDRTGAPVTMGPIAFQAEHAEVYYRNIRIRTLP